MLKATTSGPLSMELTSEAPQGDYSYNDLKGGSDVPAGYDAYVLSAAGNPAKMGFYKFDGALATPATTLNPNKAHLEIAQSSPAPAHGYIDFGEDETTSLTPERPTPDPIPEQSSPTRSLSLYGGEWYDLQGQKLSGKPTRKGIYVRNGQKMVIK